MMKPTLEQMTKPASPSTSIMVVPVLLRTAVASLHLWSLCGLFLSSLKGGMREGPKQIAMHQGPEHIA